MGSRAPGGGNQTGKLSRAAGACRGNGRRKTVYYRSSHGARGNMAGESAGVFQEPAGTPSGQQHVDMQAGGRGAAKEVRQVGVRRILSRHARSAGSDGIDVATARTVGDVAGGGLAGVADVALCAEIRDPTPGHNGTAALEGRIPGGDGSAFGTQRRLRGKLSDRAGRPAAGHGAGAGTG